jgi:glycosyltransferase involved in cell wall biosynthesis
MNTQHNLLVSVIIPTYNRANFVVEAIESVLAQTYKNFEIIVVDDGSTDGTEKTLEPYRDRIVYIYQENQGPAAARNAGIRRATGQYIAFLDSDDLWMRDKLELQVEYLDEHPDYGLIHTNFERWELCNGEVVQVRLGYRYPIPTGYIHRYMFMGGAVLIPTVLLRKECFHKVGYFSEDLWYYENFDLCLRISRYYKIGFIDKALVTIRLHGANFSQSYSRSKGAMSYIHVLRNHLMKYPEIVEEIGNQRVKRRLSEPWFDHAHESFVTGDFSEARKYLRKAIASCPDRWSYYIYYLASLFPPSMIKGLRRLKRSIRRVRRAPSVARMGGQEG